MEEKDEIILGFLRENAKLTTSKISKKTGIPITTVHNRIKKMVAEGIIKKYTVEIDYDKIGKHIPAFILINVDPKELKEKNLSYDVVAQKLKIMPEVEDAYAITGAFDIYAKIRIESVEKLNEFLVKLRKIIGIERTQTGIILSEA